MIPVMILMTTLPSSIMKNNNHIMAPVLDTAYVVGVYLYLVKESTRTGHNKTGHDMAILYTPFTQKTIYIWLCNVRSIIYISMCYTKQLKHTIKILTYTYSVSFAFLSCAILLIGVFMIHMYNIKKLLTRRK